MTAAVRVPGHTLVAEGAPFDHLRRRYSSILGGVGGAGHAKCSCGQFSPAPIPSAYQRKQWHRDHKIIALTEQPPGAPTMSSPMPATPGTDVTDTALSLLALSQYEGTPLSPDEITALIGERTPENLGAKLEIAIGMINQLAHFAAQKCGMSVEEFREGYRTSLRNTTRPDLGG